MILFAMLLPLMLGFMALAIDIGRLRVARVQMQGAADAAALAALVQLREGGGFGRAIQAANSVANEVRIQRVSGGGGSTEFGVQVRTGEWNFATSTWEDSNLKFSGVTVNLTQRQPLGLLFAPIFEMGSGSGFSGKVYSGGPDGADTGSRKVLRLGRRAAMRPRDIVLVVDITSLHREHLPDFRSSINDMVEQIRMFGVVEDRIGIVGFAGEAAMLLPLTNIDEDLSEVRFGVGDILPCEVDLASWFHWYRFVDSSLDPEVLGEPAFDYNPIWFSGVYEDGLPRMRWDVDSYEGELTLETTGEGSGLTEETWNLPLTEEGQCAAWAMSEILFQYADPRRLQPSSFTPLEFAPLDCHRGNYFQGDPDRFEWATPYPEVDCSVTGWDEAYPGHPALMDGGDPDPVYDYPDRSYAQAGTNPGAGLLMAAELLQGAWPTRNEPMVVLITAGGPECGPGIDLSAATDCDAEFEAEMALGVAALDARDVHTHVLGLVEPGSTSDVLLSAAVTGRGVYQQTQDVNDFDEFLREVGRDIRLQVVE